MTELVAFYASFLQSIQQLYKAHQINQEERDMLKNFIVTHPSKDLEQFIRSHQEKQLKEQIMVKLKQGFFIKDEGNSHCSFSDQEEQLSSCSFQCFKKQSTKDLDKKRSNSLSTQQ